MLGKLICIILFFIGVLVKAQTVINYIDTVSDSYYSSYRTEIDKSKEIISLIEKEDIDALFELYDFNSGIYSKESLRDNFEWFGHVIDKNNDEEMIVTLAKQKNLNTEESRIKSVNISYCYASKYDDFKDKFTVKFYSNWIEFEFFKASQQKKINNLLDKYEVK